MQFDHPIRTAHFLSIAVLRQNRLLDIRTRQVIGKHFIHHQRNILKNIPSINPLMIVSGRGGNCKIIASVAVPRCRSSFGSSSLCPRSLLLRQIRLLRVVPADFEANPYLCIFKRNPLHQRINQHSLFRGICLLKNLAAGGKLAALLFQALL